MSNGHHLHRQLLEQARHLATRERRRPRQGSLRRAVSTAYYALFHLIVHEAAQKLLRGNAAEPLRPLLGRAFVHGDMKAAARSFAGGTLPATIKAYQPGPVSAELRQVAEAFVVLQELRHQADYDLRARLARPPRDAGPGRDRGGRVRRLESGPGEPGGAALPRVQLVLEAALGAVGGRTSSSRSKPPIPSRRVEEDDRPAQFAGPAAPPGRPVGGAGRGLGGDQVTSAGEV